MKKKAFTLMEMLIVIIIIGILAAVLTPRFGGARNKTIESTKINYIRSSADELGIDTIYPEYDLYARSGSSSNGGDGVDSSNGIHYDLVSNGVYDIRICRDGDCITMQDRNLGATSNDISSSSSYGKYYQWGNNYQFSSFYHNTNSAIDCSPYGPENPLYN